jgi:hypothetical protein
LLLPFSEVEYRRLATFRFSDWWYLCKTAFRFGDFEYRLKTFFLSPERAYAAAYAFPFSELLIFWAACRVPSFHLKKSAGDSHTSRTPAHGGSTRKVSRQPALPRDDADFFAFPQ